MADDHMTLMKPCLFMVVDSGKNGWRGNQQLELYGVDLQLQTDIGYINDQWQ